MLCLVITVKYLRAVCPGSGICPSSILTPHLGWRWNGSPCACRWPGQWPVLPPEISHTALPVYASWFPSAAEEWRHSSEKMMARVTFFLFIFFSIYEFYSTCSHIRAMGLFMQPFTIWAPRPTVTPREVSSHTRPPILSLASSTTTCKPMKTEHVRGQLCVQQTE